MSIVRTRLKGSQGPESLWMVQAQPRPVIPQLAPEHPLRASWQFYYCNGEDLGKGAGSEPQCNREIRKMALGFKSWKSRICQPPERPGKEFPDRSRNWGDGSVGKSTCCTSMKA